jgi:hypothetical protein
MGCLIRGRYDNGIAVLDGQANRFTHPTDTQLISEMRQKLADKQDRTQRYATYVLKRLALLEEENVRLKKLVADLSLDKQILVEALDVAKNL